MNLNKVVCSIFTKCFLVVYAALLLGVVHYGYTHYGSFKFRKHKDLVRAQHLIEALLQRPVPAFRNGEVWYFSANKEQIGAFCEKPYSVIGCTMSRPSRKNYIVVLREDRFNTCSTLVHELMHVAVGDIGEHVVNIQHHDDRFMLAIALVCGILDEGNKQQKKGVVK